MAERQNTVQQHHDIFKCAPAFINTGLFFRIFVKKDCVNIKVCLKINSSQSVYLKGAHHLSNTLAIIYTCRQVRVHILFFSQSSKHWTNSHTETLPTNFAFFMKPSVKSTPLSCPLFNHKNVLKKQLIITMAIFTYVCVLHFCSFMSNVPRYAVWWDIPQNMGQYTMPCCILNTWILFLLLCC